MDELEVNQIKLMTDDSFKDITFITEDGHRIRGHKFLMMARSKYLHTMFTRYDPYEAALLSKKMKT